MDPRQLVTRAQRRINFLAGLVLASLGLVWLADFGSASIDYTSAAAIGDANVPAIENISAAAIESTSVASIVERHVPTLIASAEPTDMPQLAAAADGGVAKIDVATATDSVAAKAADTAADPGEPNSVVVASLGDPSQILAPDVPFEQTAAATTPDPVPDRAEQTVSSIKILEEECLVAEICIDRYLWALYERAPKVDSIKVHEQRKVTVRRKGKTKTVTKTFTRRVDDDFTWKDPKAAERAGMTMMDYVIGGMDRSFKLKLFHTLHAAEQAGLSPGITSAFRDDYRQSIASGLKAASDRSYHGGSLRGGYGRGVAADVVSVKGATRAQRWVSTDKLWKWIDEHGKEFGIGRPYLDRDPPHVAPIDGKEYASRRGGAKTQDAQANTRKGKRLAARDDHSKAKRPKTAKSSKGRTI